MPKKNTQKKLSAIQKFALVSLALIILMIGGTYLYVSGKGNQIANNVMDYILINPSIKDKPVKDMITYTLPSGWTEDTDSQYLKESGTILLKSADYKENSTQWDNDGTGVVVSLDVSPKYRFVTLKSEKRYWKNHSLSDYMKLSDISIDGVAGLRYEFSYNGTYTLEYFFIKDKYSVKIYVNNIDNTDIEEKYWNDINTILDSVHFK